MVAYYIAMEEALSYGSWLLPRIGSPPTGLLQQSASTELGSGWRSGPGHACMVQQGTLGS